MEKDYYEILGVNCRATQQNISKAFRDKSRTWHPDKFAGDKEKEESFKELSEAYAVLKNPHKRFRYDIFGLSGLGRIIEGGWERDWREYNPFMPMGDFIDDFIEECSENESGLAERFDIEGMLKRFKR